MTGTSTVFRRRGGQQKSPPKKAQQGKNYRRRGSKHRTALRDGTLILIGDPRENGVALVSRSNCWHFSKEEFATMRKRKRFLFCDNECPVTFVLTKSKTPDTGKIVPRK